MKKNVNASKIIGAVAFAAGAALVGRIIYDFKKIKQLTQEDAVAEPEEPTEVEAEAEVIEEPVEAPVTEEAEATEVEAEVTEEAVSAEEAVATEEPQEEPAAEDAKAE